jgi:hypothetical protein
MCENSAKLLKSNYTRTYSVITGIDYLKHFTYNMTNWRFNMDYSTSYLYHFSLIYLFRNFT